MILAIVGSRSLCCRLEKFVEFKNIEKIVTGGSHGIDYSACQFAKKNKIPLNVIRPDYKLYGNIAPIIRNKEIVNSCDELLAIWDGFSKGTKSAIDFAVSLDKKATIFVIKNDIIKKYHFDSKDQLSFF